MRLQPIRLFVWFLSFVLIATSLRAAPTRERPPSTEDGSIPLVTDYPPNLDSPPELDSEKMRLKRYKVAAAVVLATLATMTIGLIASGADTGKDARSSS
ncbi:MAG: hypothetical protein AAF443_04295 [Chlamydiota bacterium]